MSEAVSAEELGPGEVGTHQLPYIAESCAIILESSLSIFINSTQAGPGRKVKLLHPFHLPRQFLSSCTMVP